MMAQFRKFEFGPKPVSMTVEDAMAYTGLGKASIYEAVKSGKLVTRKSGRRTLFLTEDLERFIALLPEGPVISPELARRKLPTIKGFHN